MAAPAQGRHAVKQRQRRLPIVSVTVRPLSRRNIGDLRDALACGAIAETTGRLLPRSLPSIMDWHDQILRTKETYPFAILHRSKFIGYGALRSPIFSGKELAIGIFDLGYHGAGLGTFAVNKLCAFAFEKLKLHRVELGVYPSNRRAIACYARCGFKYEALLRKFMYHEGEWQDVMWMSLLRSEWRFTGRPRGQENSRTIPSRLEV